MPQQRIRLYLKNRLNLERLTFDQKRMFRLGTIAVGTVKDRVKRAMNETDSRSKPLNKRYAIRKTRFGKRNVRDLNYSGQMMTNFSLRTVNDNEAFARNTTKDNQNKARFNQNKERWIVYSRTNVDAIMKAANKEFSDVVKNMVKTVPAGFVK